MNIKLSIILLFLNFIAFASEDPNAAIWNKTINWEKNRIDIHIKTPLKNSESTLAYKRLKAENWINDNLTDIFFKNILDIQINSLDTVSEIINKKPEIYFKLDNLGESIESKTNVLSTNLEYLDSVYSFSIYPDFVNVFYTNSNHNKVPKKLDHLDYGDFSGLIIYVPEGIPSYKKQDKASLTKVLFPRIFDEDMNLIMDLSMVEPEYMKKWGMVIYGNSFDENLYQKRIGISPLRIIAKGLFGTNNSDIIISKEEADKLIGSTKNLNIISQSRILIIN
ncbi:MAG: hypothetical protein OCD02_16700 [Spirochaetaceae bacterium]